MTLHLYSVKHAAGKTIIGKYDLDAPLFCSFKPTAVGISYKGSQVLLPKGPGLGIEKMLV
jgi:hypothetical protein